MSKKFKLVIECDEFYVAASLRELGNMIENDDWNLETEPEVAYGHYTAQVSVVGGDEPTPSGKPYEIAEEKLKRFVELGGDLSVCNLILCDNDGDDVCATDILFEDNRYYVRTEYGERWKLTACTTDELIEIEKAIDQAIEDADGEGVTMEDKLTKFVSQGGEVTTPLYVTDRDGNRTLVRRIFSSYDRFWLTTCDDEDILLSDLPNADLDAIEEYLDASGEQAVVVEPESNEPQPETTTDKAIFEFDSTFKYSEVMTFTREHCERLCNDCEDRVTKYVITDTKSLDDVLNFSIDSDHCSYRAFL